MRIIHFGTNGWRERVGDGFDEESVARLASSFGLVWGSRHEGARVLVGYDTREDGRSFACVVAGVVAGFGLDVRLSNVPCPLPALEWAVANDASCCGGVMVTASDAPCDYNGILARGEDGGAISEAFANEIDRGISAEAPTDRVAFTEVDFVSPYYRALVGEVDGGLISSVAPSVVVDAMFGPARGGFASALRKLGCKVTEIHSPDRPNFEGIHPRVTEPWVDDCERAVLQSGADLGIAIDGDCARSAVVDGGGRLVSPHDTIPLIMRHVVLERGASGRVVMTMASSSRVSREAERLGLECTSVPVGFQRLYAEAKVGDVLMASDEYGGICFPTHLRERDGLLVALLAIEAVCASGKGIRGLVDQIASENGHMDYARKDLRLEPALVQSFRNVLPGLNPREVAGRAPKTISHADGLKLGFEDDSWVMLRPSRAQSVVRAYAEAPTPEQRDGLLDAVCSLALSDR